MEASVRVGEEPAGGANWKGLLIGAGGRQVEIIRSYTGAAQCWVMTQVDFEKCVGRRYQPVV